MSSVTRENLQNQNEVKQKISLDELLEYKWQTSLCYILKYLARNENDLLGWRDGSVVKSTDCSSEGPEFKSQQPHGGSQLSVTGSDALFWSV